MAHFALVDENNVVVDVFFLDNSVITDENGEEQEALGIQHMHHHHGDDFGVDAKWIQTSFNQNFRGNYAFIGGKYHTDVRTLGKESVDVFLPPKPFASWLLHELEARWVSPAGDPPELTEEQEAAGEFYIWDEDGWSNSTRTGDETGWVLVNETTVANYLD